MQTMEPYSEFTLDPIHRRRRRRRRRRQSDQRQF